MDYDGQLKRHKEVRRLHDKEHLAFDTIAAQLNIPLSMVKRVYQRAPKKSGRPLGSIYAGEIKLHPDRTSAERKALRKAFDDLGKWDRLYFAKRLGIHKQTLHNAVNPNSETRLGKERILELAKLFREMASEVVQISYDLDRAARVAYPTLGGPNESST
jgi:predicted DNA-binding protein (UPF0251 family)